jgi:orotidine-5'-phosphate decarboxylase
MTKPLRVKDLSKNSKDRIIIALDVEKAAHARDIVAELRHSVGAFKIGLQLFTSEGPAFVSELTRSGLKIFLDLKFHDIPNTVAKASIEAVRLGVWMFNLHILGGPDMMKSSVEEVANICEKENLERPNVIGVSVLTSSDSSTLAAVGIDADVNREVERLASLAFDCGLDGVVASPNEAALVRKAIPRKDFMIVTPGVRPANATSDDQKRVMTPGEALRIGSDYLVVGRPVTASRDRSSVLEGILNEIESLIESPNEE